MNQDSSTAAGWYETTRVASPARSRLNFDLDVEVCVIGAGLAGLTVAREIARRGWSVAVLEGGSVAQAASGRNTGFVLPGYSESIDSMIERIGLDQTKQLWALSEQGLAYVRRTIDETAMPGVEKVPGWLHVDQTDDAATLNAHVERLRWIGADAEMWDTERVRSQLVNKRYFNAVHFPKAFHIHPLNYALGLAAAAEQAGARIFEDTPALSIDAAGVRKRIVTPSGLVRAARVVLAGNVQLSALMPEISATLVPVTTFVMVTEPLGRQLHDLIRYRGAVSDTNRADNHYRIVDGNRLQWSGRARVWSADPRRFARGLVADIKRNFPDLGPVEVAHIWSGTLGRTVHRMPQIGEVEPGVWLTSGFGGHGLNTTAMAGELVARGIVEGDETWRLFAPYELVWAGGALGKLLVQALYWGRTPRERIAQALARYRESRRIAKTAPNAALEPPAETVEALSKALSKALLDRLSGALPAQPGPVVSALEPALQPAPVLPPVAVIEPQSPEATVGQPEGQANFRGRENTKRSRRTQKPQKRRKKAAEPPGPP
jgi:glycine/D-amino acid oxidase-like deaminating enzyme